MTSWWMRFEMRAEGTKHGHTNGTLVLAGEMSGTS